MTEKTVVEKYKEAGELLDLQLEAILLQERVEEALIKLAANLKTLRCHQRRRLHSEIFVTRLCRGDWEVTL